MVRYNAIAYSVPNATDLPDPCINLARPFLYTDMDYTSHIWIKAEEGKTKMYILIFTCMSIRAVHIGLVPDMCISAFLQALI